MLVLIPLLLACCGVIVVFALLVPRRPIIAGFGIAFVVLVILLAARSLSHPGRSAAVWPRFIQSHVPRAPRPPDTIRLADLQRELAEIRLLREEVTAGARQKAKEAYSKALEEASALGYEVILADGKLALVASEDTGSRSVSAVISDWEGVKVHARERTRVRSPFRVRGHQARSHDEDVQHGGVLWSVLTAVEIAAFLCVGYVFLDGATRGQFTWALRIASVAAFAAIWVAMASLRHQL